MISCVTDTECPLMNECDEFMRSMPKFGDEKHNPFYVYLYLMIWKVWYEYHPGMKCQMVFENDD